MQFDDVSLSFSGHPLFEHASFTLQKGERCGLIGRNGSGKSTLFRLIEGEMEPDKGAISVSKNYRIGYLQQHIHFTKPTLLEEAALGLPPGEEDHLYKAERILFGLGFSEEDLEASPGKFSGGYHLRLHLAKVLISEPNCLLLDEPTNYLDILSMRWLARFLSQWKGEFILISHDRDFMDQVTTHTMGIHREKVRKMRGTTLDFFGQILLEEEVHERTRVKADKKRAHLQGYIDRFGAKASKAGQAQARKKALEREPVLEKLNQISALSFEFNEAPFPGKKLLDAKHLKFSYTDEPLIPDFSLEIEKGERVALIGKNGRGKSTLLRLIGKDLGPESGTLTYSENTRIGYFGQTHVERLSSARTIEQEIAQANPQLNFTQVKAIAGLMLFSGALAEKKISVLSGGEKSRVLLGKIVATPCNLLLLDEPTHHLDIESIEALIDALEDFSGSVVIVTHSELILRRLNLDKIILCEESKQTLFLGSYDEFLEKIGWEEEKKERPPKKAPPPDRKLLDRAIASAEKELSRLEEEMKKNEALLSSGDPQVIQTFRMQQKKLEELESKLYSLYEQYAASKQKP
ncbi:MAG: ABC-F family ATP-binding cassette domain-containing protein [Verrucomicrobia bacterium]|nr:ABC-F family ATP-binding cassette domain-containing protein [Verrucomicrobiota bacterium]